MEDVNTLTVDGTLLSITHGEFYNSALSAV